MESLAQRYILRVSFFDVEVTLKPVKALRMRVGRDGGVRISAPLGTSMAQVERFVRSKHTWIAQAQERVRASLDRERLADGGTIPIWGVAHTIRVERTVARSRRAYIEGDALIVPLSPAKDSAEGLEKACAAFLASEVRRVLDEGMAARMEARCSVRASSWRVRSMRTRWGSCQVVKGIVTLNAQLARYPRQCLEYVVCHELCHLHEPSHNARFHALMDRFYPDWNGVKKLLRERIPT